MGSFFVQMWWDDNDGEMWNFVCIWFLWSWHNYELDLVGSKELKSLMVKQFSLWTLGKFMNASFCSICSEIVHTGRKQKHSQWRILLHLEVLHHPDAHTSCPFALADGSTTRVNRLMSKFQMNSHLGANKSSGGGRQKIKVWQWIASKISYSTPK